MPGVPGESRFVGQLTDPWVASLARAMPAGTGLLDLDGPLPAWDELGLDDPADLWVVHRSVLRPADLAWLRAFSEAPGRPERRLLLVVGPHVRFHQVQRCQGWVDGILDESTAIEALRGLGTPALAGPSPRIAVVGATHDLLSMVASACRLAGHETRIDRGDLAGVAERLVVWEAPVLEAGWEAQLLRAGAGLDRQVIPLIGLADREQVEAARRAGAFACLGLPFDLDELTSALQRASRLIPCGLGEGGRPGLFRGPHTRRGLALSGDDGQSAAGRLS